ncbi:hypothetical protein Gbth_027_002 [Gluconobacter thailandicus F149-1 = NBRC 100600]|jgi:single-strand DNA-binding protein|uniref:Single-stranded DNA-binding protein n=7 Tax=Acetobacteraceae TaxID=433 RepID=A0A2S3VXP2_9PROT|nr:MULTISPECIES: single-stranded DNA-binding protein [Acetobacteraceae]GBO82138.1 hypothetical protein AA0242T_2840 [Acetobacter aceti NRIC 0242]KXV29454.1 hypothetical protein AD937_00625 [Gluconobacter japonicus]KXV54301.1 hypothetical protein AD946_03525 [Gluconobacter thailandicus]KXV61005.1 hypothetical protein AD947_01375 [Acetobacter tropicalis]POF61366.1 hypothetical protein KMAL_30200 [Novacetimonas maltaceti]
MFPSINLSGRVGKDATRKTFGNGGGYVVFRVACSKNVRSQQSETGWRELTEWVEVRVDLRQEKRAEYVEKNATQGRQVEVRGDLRSATFRPQGATNDVTIWYVDPTDFEFKGRPAQQRGQGADAPPADQWEGEDPFDRK